MKILTQNKVVVVNQKKIANPDKYFNLTSGLGTNTGSGMGGFANQFSSKNPFTNPPPKTIKPKSADTTYFPQQNPPTKNIQSGNSLDTGDGSVREDVRSFQHWANINKSAGLVEDGRYYHVNWFLNGTLSNTQKAYNKYGAEWEISKLAGNTTGNAGTGTGNTGTGNSGTGTGDTGTANTGTGTGNAWNKISKGLKIGIIVGGVLLVAGIVAIVIHKANKGGK